MPKTKKKEMHEWLVMVPITGVAHVTVTAESEEAAKAAAANASGDSVNLGEWEMDTGSSRVRVERND